MSSIGFSSHARVRMQQRSIPDIVVELLWEYGASTRVGGADRLHFSRHARARAQRALKSMGIRGKEHMLDAYVVVGDNGLVVTAAWRTVRLKGPRRDQARIKSASLRGEDTQT